MPLGELQTFGDLICRVNVTVAQHGLEQAPYGTQSEQVQIAARGGDPAHVEVACAGARALRRGAHCDRFGRPFRARLHHTHHVVERDPTEQFGNDYLTTEFGLDPTPQMQGVQRVESQRHQRHRGIQRFDVVGPDHLGQQRKQNLFDGYTGRKGARTRIGHRSRSGAQRRHHVVECHTAQKVRNRHLTTEFGLDPPPQGQSVQRVQTQRHQGHRAVERLKVVGPDHFGEQLQRPLRQVHHLGGRAADSAKLLVGLLTSCDSVGP